jgi:UDP-N-acetylglucosamine/UDP-N-acetyl-alpha-D-glucosaminouronate 4-epimerase
MSRISLVTGGAGFIGSNVVRRLLERGDRVRVLDNFSSGNRKNLRGFENDVDVVEGDLRSYERVHAAVRGVECVFHQGALPSVPRSVQDPLTTNAVNVEGTLNVLLAARDEGVRRLIFASSSSVYGNVGVPPRLESTAPNPISPYAISKLAAESYCTGFHEVYGLETVSLRYFNVFGENQDPMSQYAAVVPRFFSAVRDDQPVPIYGDGRQSRDFTHVENVVDANMQAAETEGIGGSILNIATGRATTVEDLADLVASALGKTAKKDYLPPRPVEVRDSWASTEQARQVVGYEARIGLEEGLRLVAQRYEEGK